MATKIFVNLPVKNLDRSVEFLLNLDLVLTPSLLTKLPLVWL